MKALYIGYSKTGTKTMNAVFKILGYKCYDYEENIYYLGDEWEQIFKDGGSPEDFKRIYSDVDAAVDVPVYFFWEQILEAFPDVKLLVSYRDDESFVRSSTNQGRQFAGDTKFKIMSMLSPTAQRFAKFSRICGNRFWGSDRNVWPWQFFHGLNYTLLLNDYRKHNSHVKQRALELGDQLHVVNYKDGWEPICKFLGEPIPDAPFPHANMGGDLLKQYVKSSPLFAPVQREIMITLTLITALISGGAFAAFTYFKKH